jgi:hypothetical protein
MKLFFLIYLKLVSLNCFSLYAIKAKPIHSLTYKRRYANPVYLNENTNDNENDSNSKINHISKNFLFCGDLGDSNKSCLDRFVRSIENPVYQVWKILVIITCIVSSYVYAYISAFSIPDPNSYANKMCLAFEVICGCDIIVCKYINI